MARSGKVELSHKRQAKARIAVEISKLLDKAGGIARLVTLNQPKMLYGRRVNGVSCRQAFNTDDIFYIEKIKINGHSDYTARLLPMPAVLNSDGITTKNVQDAVDAVMNSPMTSRDIEYINVPLSYFTNDIFIYGKKLEGVFEALQNMSVMDVAEQILFEETEEYERQRQKEMMEKYGEEFGSW